MLEMIMMMTPSTSAMADAMPAALWPNAVSFMYIISTAFAPELL